MMADTKRIGSVWRIKYNEAPAKRGGMYGPSHELRSADVPCLTVFDEFVLAFPKGSIHLEQMSYRCWFLGVGDDKVMITIDRQGRPVMGEWYK